MFQRGGIVVSRTPENWQNGAETEGMMRRAQLIGLAGIVVASGLWATPAAGQTSEPWEKWRARQDLNLRPSV